MQPLPFRQRGFTLLEVMLVLVLMGLAVSYVVYNAVGSSYAEDLEKQTKRFQVVVDMASDFAVLNQQELGLRVDEKKNLYLFMLLGEDDKWLPLEEDKLFASHQLPDQFKVELELEDLPWIEEDSLFDQGIFDEQLSFDEDRPDIGEEEEKRLPPPQILLLSSGEITPFSLSFIYEPEFSTEDPVYFRVNAIDTPPLERLGPLDSL